MVKELFNEEKTAGSYEVELDAAAWHSNEGQKLKEEIYFYRLEAEDFISTKKMSLKRQSEYSNVGNDLRSFR